MTRGGRDASKHGLCAHCRVRPRKVYSTGRTDSYCTPCIRAMAKVWDANRHKRPRRGPKPIEYAHPVEGNPRGVNIGRRRSHEAVVDEQLAAIAEGLILRYCCWECQREVPTAQPRRVEHPYADAPATLIANDEFPDLPSLLCGECAATFEADGFHVLPGQ